MDDEERHLMGSLLVTQGYVNHDFNTDTITRDYIKELVYYLQYNDTEQMLDEFIMRLK